MPRRFPKAAISTALKVVFDGANGAAYKVGPRTLNELGAEVITIGCSPNGRNINAGCGSTEPGLLQQTVPAVQADVGIALDGDGDRVVMVDETGDIVDGDQLLYMLATARKEEGRLTGPVVGTVMSNLGLEHALRDQHIDFRSGQSRRSLRTGDAAGDRRHDRRRNVRSHDRAWTRRRPATA